MLMSKRDKRTSNIPHMEVKHLSNVRQYAQLTWTPVLVFNSNIKSRWVWCVCGGGLTLENPSGQALWALPLVSIKIDSKMHFWSHLVSKWQFETLFSWKKYCCWMDLFQNRFRSMGVKWCKDMNFYNFLFKNILIQDWD